MGSAIVHIIRQSNFLQACYGDNQIDALARLYLVGGDRRLFGACKLGLDGDGWNKFGRLGWW